MKQIGELVGVSQSTVSRVLNGAPSIVPVAPETRERVLKLVADLGYTPNPVARALRSARTGLIGMIVRDINDPFFAAAVAAISAQIQAHRYSVLLGHVDSSARKANELRDLLAMGHCEGAILLGDLRDQAALWADGAAHGIPLVGLWQGAREPHIPVVNVDNRAGIRLAIEHLVSLATDASRSFKAVERVMVSSAATNSSVDCGSFGPGYATTVCGSRTIHIQRQQMR